MQNQCSCLKPPYPIGSGCGYAGEAAVVRTVSLLHDMVFKTLVSEREPAAGPKRKRAAMVSREHLPFSAEGNGSYERCAGPK